MDVMPGRVLCGPRWRAAPAGQPVFDDLDAQQLADVWEALYDAREAARASHTMFKSDRLGRMILELYKAPAWDDRAMRELI